jgi:hypothetical protein
LNPVKDFASGKSQVFAELEMWEALDSATAGVLVHPRVGDLQELSNLNDCQIVVIDGAFARYV